LVSINVAALCQIQLVMGLLTIYGGLNISVCNNLHRSTQRTIPPRSFGIPGLTRQPASTSDGGGEQVIPRPVVRGPMAGALPRSRSPVPLSGRFGRATAGYVDRPQAAMGSLHRPGTAPGPTGDRPSPFAPPPAIQLRSRTRTQAKSRASIETRELRLSSRECDFPGINIPSLYSV